MTRWGRLVYSQMAEAFNKMPRVKGMSLEEIKKKLKSKHQDAASKDLASKDVKMAVHRGLKNNTLCQHKQTGKFHLCNGKEKSKPKRSNSVSRSQKTSRKIISTRALSRKNSSTRAPSRRTSSTRAPSSKTSSTRAPSSKNSPTRALSSKNSSITAPSPINSSIITSSSKASSTRSGKCRHVRFRMRQQKKTNKSNTGTGKSILKKPSNLDVCGSDNDPEIGSQPSVSAVGSGPSVSTVGSGPSVSTVGSGPMAVDSDLKINRSNSSLNSDCKDDEIPDVNSVIERSASSNTVHSDLVESDNNDNMSIQEEQDAPVKTSGSKLLRKRSSKTVCKNNSRTRLEFGEGEPLKSKYRRNSQDSDCSDDSDCEQTDRQIILSPLKKPDNVVAVFDNNDTKLIGSHLPAARIPEGCFHGNRWCVARPRRALCHCCHCCHHRHWHWH